MAPTETGRVVLTDPEPIPADARCPKCNAKPDRRVDAAGFGQKRVIVCGVCGFEFPPGE